MRRNRLRLIRKLAALALAPLIGLPAVQASAQGAEQLEPGSGQFTLFRDRNFAGPSMVMHESSSSFSFSPRSARLSGGAWLICARPFFGGRCDEVRADTAKLNLHRSFSGMVRSARPVALAAPTQPKATPDPPKPAPPPEPPAPDKPAETPKP